MAMKFPSMVNVVIHRAFTVCYHNPSLLILIEGKSTESEFIGLCKTNKELIITTDQS